MGLLSGCDLGGYEEEYQWGERVGEPGKGPREDSIWMFGGEVADIVDETEQPASEEEEGGLKKGWTWPREGKDEGERQRDDERNRQEEGSRARRALWRLPGISRARDSRPL